MNDIEKAAIDWLNCERENYAKDGVYYYFMSLAISALEKQQNGSWIPVIERLPECDYNRLVTTENSEIYTSKFYGYGEECQGFKEFPDGVWEIEAYGETVIAWQALPEPYKEEKQ